MATLIFDIETVGEDFDSLDETTQESLTRWIKKESASDEDYRIALEDLKQGLGFSPLTGEIIVIGVLDYEKNQGAVYFQAPNSDLKEFEENSFRFKPLTEKEMLTQFWQGAASYQEFVSFNGRCFDAPFLMIRSAVHQIRPTKNLLSNRYLSSQKFEAQHVDLLDQLTFYGALRRHGNLHLWSRVFGIESPKAAGITGDDVADLFEKRKFLEIARYNTRDLLATRDLYHRWQTYLKT